MHILKILIIGILISLIALWIIFPLFIMVKISLSPEDEVLRQHPYFFTQQPTLKHWRRVIESGLLVQPLKKSFIVACIAVIITLLIAVPGAYGIARLPRHIRHACLLAIFFTRMFPEIGIALPIAIQFVRWNLLDTEIGLALAHVIRVLPIACWILVGVFQTIPKEIEEQAMVDGCTRIEVLRRLVLPLSLGGISVAAIFSWLFSWDEFTYALYLCLAEPTLPLKVYHYINRGSWFSTATYGIIITIPVVIVTYSFQRFLKAGYTAGALKG